MNCRSCFPMSKYVPTMHSFNSEEIFMSYSFVSPRKNLSNLRKYILGNVLTFLDSFPPSNAAKIAGCDISIRMTLGLLMPLVHNCQQCTVLILRRYFCSTAVFGLETTSETSPNIYLIMFRPLQIVSVSQI